jgi:hypothetical protein
MCEMSPPTFGKRKRRYVGQKLRILDRIIERQGPELLSIPPKLTSINGRDIVTHPDQHHLVSFIFCRHDNAASTLFRRIGKGVSNFIIIPDVGAIKQSAGVAHIDADSRLPWYPPPRGSQKFQC